MISSELYPYFVDGTKVPNDVIPYLQEKLELSKKDKKMRVIEASRRTDMSTGNLWINLFESMKRGYTITFNPRYLMGAKEGKIITKNQAYSVRLIDPNHTTFLSFWSKDPGKFLSVLKTHPRYKTLLQKYPAIFFSYSLNGSCPILEPGIKKTLQEKLQDLEDLVNFLKDFHMKKTEEKNDSKKSEKDSNNGKNDVEKNDDRKNDDEKEKKSSLDLTPFILVHFDPIVVFKLVEQIEYESEDDPLSQYKCPLIKNAYWNLNKVELIFEKVNKLLYSGTSIFMTFSFVELVSFRQVKKQMQS
jgi:hypothetical protein